MCDQKAACSVFKYQGFIGNYCDFHGEEFVKENPAAYNKQKVSFTSYLKNIKKLSFKSIKTNEIHY